MRTFAVVGDVEGAGVDPSRFLRLSRLRAVIRAASFALVPYGFSVLGGSGGSNLFTKSPPEKNTSKNVRREPLCESRGVSGEFEPPSRPAT